MRPIDAAVLGAVASVVSAAGLVDITDLPLYNSLVPCAARAISEVFGGLTSTSCPTGVTPLQSCACTKDNNAAAIGSRLASRVLSYYCTKTATDDVSSVSVVFSYYCNQGATAPAFSNAGASVSLYISDLPAYSALAPCASSALSYAVQSLTYSICPTDQSALASCACTKNHNSQDVSQLINSSVFYKCGSTHSEDATSAQAVFAGYCGLVAGVTSFPTASALPGQLSYYITDLPDYSALAPCAARALSTAVLGQTDTHCPTDPENLVSCVCVKDKNSQSVSSLIVSTIKYSCGSTASSDVTSGLALFDLYCSAGKGLVTPSGVTNSVAPTVYGTGAATVVQATTGPKRTGTGTEASSSTGTDSAPGATPTSSSGGSNVGLIAGVAGGVVGVIAIAVVAWAIWFCRRRKKQRLAQAAAPAPGVVDEKTGFIGGKAELDNSTMLSDMPPKDSALSTHTPLSAVSPDSSYAVPAMGKGSELPSPHGSVNRKPGVAEMPSRHDPSEMQGQGIAMPMPGPGLPPQRHEMQGQGMAMPMPGPDLPPQRHEMQGQDAHIYEMSPMGSQGQGQGQGQGGRMPLYGQAPGAGMPQYGQMQYGQVQGGMPQYQPPKGGPPYAQVQQGGPVGQGGSYVAYNPQGYAPVPSQSPNPTQGHNQGPYEMPGQRWE